MSRGGRRPGAGRPGKGLSETLPPTRVRPEHLAMLQRMRRQVAGVETLSDAVRYALDLAADSDWETIA